MFLFGELKRRNVFKVGIAYAVAAWILLQLTDVVAEILQLPEWAPKFILLILVVGLVPALIFAWAFEMTPEGVKREKDVDRSETITSRTGKKLNGAISVLLVLAVAYLLYDKFSEKGSEPFSQAPTAQVIDVGNEKRDPTPAVAEAVISRQSIAVLPFDNRSDQKSDEYFVEGIHDDLLTNLARIGALKVISRTSVMRYKDTEKPIPEIAKELGVATIMEGAVQRSGSTVRINVQLIDAETDEHLWAEIYDRQLSAENLFAIQSEISQAIAAALKATLSPEEQQRINTVPTDNLAAYDAYLRGRKLMATRDSAKLKLATEAFTEAVELDPQFALAWVNLADSTLLLTDYGTLSNDIALPIRKNAIEHAIAIDDQLGEAYASLAQIHGDHFRYAEAETALQRSIELSPNYATAYHWYSLFLNSFPLRVQESITLVQKAAELDPGSSIIGVNVAGAYARQGLYSLAERQLGKVMQLDPKFVQTFIAMANLNTFTLGKFDIGVEYALKAIKMDPGNISNLAALSAAYAQLGDFTLHDATLRKMEDVDPNHWWTAFITVISSISKDNPAGTRETINWALPKFKYVPGFVMVMANIELGLGDAQRAREIYITAHPGWLEPAQWEQLIGRYASRACIVSWLLINTGDAQLGTALLARTTAYLDEALPAVMEHTDRYAPETCYLTAGDTDKALDSLATQLAHNHLFGWNLNHKLPMYDLIRDEPRYPAMLAERERRIAVQREAVAKMDTGAGL